MCSSKTNTPLITTLLAMIVILPYRGNAQLKNDTLKAVKIHGTRKQQVSDIRVTGFSTGQKIQAIDSITMQQYNLQNLATLLSQQMPVFVKSYSFNGLATLQFRGASAAQSQVLWNGVPIQNASLGLADISTIPVLLMNKVNIVYGSSGALLGSGNVGGALLLENNSPAFDTNTKGVTVTGGTGSFGQYSGGLAGYVSRKKWYVSANTYLQTALNDYEYKDASGKYEKMQNARLQSNAAIVQAARKLNDNNTIGITLWHQRYVRYIPPALFEPYSAKKQQDESIRMVADWKQQQGNNTNYAKASIIRDEIRYDDDAVQITFTNAVYQFYSEAGRKMDFGQYGKMLLFAPIQYSWVHSSIAADSQKQFRYGLAAAYSLGIFKDKVALSVQGRGEVINGQSIFLPGAGLTYKPASWLQFRANAQRTYRMPSLNELYYFPGGNKYLKPEHGWSQDIGYTIKTGYHKFHAYHDLSVFNRNIHDWILWLGGAVWTPHNIATVHSRGIETENKLTYGSRNWQLHMGINTAYVIATTISSYIVNDGSKGKQIPYTPRYNARINTGLQFKRFYLNYNHTYTGYRFITTDESSFLLPYQTGNIQAMYRAHLFGKEQQFNVQFNNVWGEEYAVIGYRPMPRANWLLGFKFQF